MPRIAARSISPCIFYTYPDGRTVTYSVTKTSIYEDTADWRLPATEGGMLVTCWPGNAPGKYQITAHLQE